MHNTKRTKCFLVQIFVLFLASFSISCRRMKINYVVLQFVI